MQTQLFNFHNQQVRTLVINNKPYFVATDVTKILGLTNTTVALSRLDDDERSKFNLGRQGETNIVNEFKNTYIPHKWGKAITSPNHNFISFFAYFCCKLKSFIVLYSCDKERR